MASPIIAHGTCYVLFAYDVAHAFDLAAAERQLASATQRQTVKQKRRAPAFFEYDPAPLRVTEPAESRPLSQQKVSDALTSRLSFGPNDATLIDTDATLLFDPEGEDVRAVIEFANTQLLEMRYLDAQLDEALERAYDLLGRTPGLRRFLPSPYGLPLRRLGRLQLDAAVLFEQVTNALKLIGEQYLTRVYGHVSRRFHLAEWDVS